MIGKTLGQCEIVAQLGRGAMGEFYRARDASLEVGTQIAEATADGGAEESLLDLPLGCIGYEIDDTGRTLFWVADEPRIDLRLADAIPEPERRP